MQRAFASLLFAICASAGNAAAQDAAPSDPDIVVTGQRTEEAIQNFVDQLTVEMRGADQLARWDRRICPGVAGLRARYAQFVIDRIAQRAFDVGLNVGDPGCRANILIVVSPAADAIAEELFENNRDAMGWFDERGRRSLGRDALRDFVASDAPVRWWHVSRTVTRDGVSLGETSGTAATTAGETAEFDAPVVFVTGNSSRLSRATHQDLGAGFIIVDAQFLPGIDFDLAALADYLAMVALAQVDADADTAELSTILNLFSGEGRPRELTEWDVSYLRGLYSGERDASGARQQGDIARTMNQELQAHE